MIRAALMLLLALAAAPAGSGPRDPGGSVALRVIEIGVFEAQRQEKRVAGECLSACTLYLGLSTACFAPDAVLGFHRPVYPDGAPLAGQAFEVTTRLMGSYYPPRLRDWWMATARHSDRLLLIPARDLIDRGEARACD